MFFTCRRYLSRGCSLLIEVFTSLVDDEAAMRLVDLLAHHVIDGGIDAVHRGRSSLSLAVDGNDVDSRSVQDLLQTSYSVNLAIAGLYLVARRNVGNVGSPSVVDAGFLQDALDFLPFY